jgi:hypothetical protein
VFVVLVFVLTLLPAAIGQAKKKAPFSGALSNSTGINRLSLARLALFAARDVWFVVSVPIFLASVLGWAFTQVGGFMALWVIAYGGVQKCVIRPARQGNRWEGTRPSAGQHPRPRTCGGDSAHPDRPSTRRTASGDDARGLVLFGIVFALNSSVHSYLVLACSEADRVSLSVGFYYMANACGRLLGTLLSGVLYQLAGVSASLWGGVVLASVAGVVAMPPVQTAVAWTSAKGDD